MNKPFFSVIIPTYNRAHLIGKTVKSVLEQTFTNWELLIIDDGSTDNTKEIVEKFQDSRIKYIWQQNQERSAARNIGIAIAVGDFICFLDSDDIWRNKHLASLFDKIVQEGHKKAIYFTGIAWNFPSHTQTVVFPSPINQNSVEYVIANQIAPSSVSIASSILKQEKFNTSLKINEDVELFARIAVKYDLIQIPEISVDFIIHEENTRALEKNYLLAQMRALKIIFSSPLLKKRISSRFKAEQLQGLRHQLINYYLNTGQFLKMNLEIIRFLVLYPSHFQNKSKIVLLLYHLPAGSLLQRLVTKLKR